MDFGDALEKGIGVMTDEHIKSFFHKMVSAGVVATDLEYTKTGTTQFFGEGMGMDLKR